MRHDNAELEKNSGLSHSKTHEKSSITNDFVLEKSIFTNIFEKDIRRVFIYKKAERLAKAIHLISPAFADSVSLKNRMDRIAVGLIDAAILPPLSARTALSRELLTLSSVLSVASTAGSLSPMNAELIIKEVHVFLHEIASYEEPRLSFDDAQTLAMLAKQVSTRAEQKEIQRSVVSQTKHTQKAPRTESVKDTSLPPDGAIKDRRETILSVIKDKGNASIKDISTLIRSVSEKTIQRELASLIDEGRISKQGERRWSVYSLR